MQRRPYSSERGDAMQGPILKPTVYNVTGNRATFLLRSNCCSRSGIAATRLEIPTHLEGRVSKDQNVAAALRAYSPNDQTAGMAL